MHIRLCKVRNAYESITIRVERNTCIAAECCCSGAASTSSIRIDLLMQLLYNRMMDVCEMAFVQQQRGFTI